MWFLFYSNRSGRGDVLKNRDKRGKMLGARSYMKRFEESDETPSFTFQSQALGICFHATVLTRSQEEINEKGYSGAARRGAASWLRTFSGTIKLKAALRCRRARTAPVRYPPLSLPLHPRIQEARLAKFP